MGQKRKLISDEDHRLEKNRCTREVYAALPNTKSAEFVVKKQQSHVKSKLSTLSSSFNCIEDMELNTIITQSIVQLNAFILDATASVLEAHQNLQEGATLHAICAFC